MKNISFIQRKISSRSGIHSLKCSTRPFFKRGFPPPRMDDFEAESKLKFSRAISPTYSFSAQIQARVTQLPFEFFVCSLRRAATPPDSCSLRVFASLGKFRYTAPQPFDFLVVLFFQFLVHSDVSRAFGFVYCLCPLICSVRCNIR